MTSNNEEIVLCPTKAGKGYKVVHNGKWFYTSTQELQKVVSGENKAVTFRTIKEIEKQREILKESQTDLAVIPAPAGITK